MQPQGLVIHGVDFSGADSGGAAKIRVVTRDMSDLRAPVVSMSTTPSAKAATVPSARGR